MIFKINLSENKLIKFIIAVFGIIDIVLFMLVSVNYVQAKMDNSAPKLPERYARVYIVNKHDKKLSRAEKTAFKFWHSCYKFRQTKRESQANIVVKNVNIKKHHIWLGYEEAGYKNNQILIVLDEKRIRHYRCTLSSTFEHELGHALGLDHDNNKHSIMYPRNTSNNHKRQVITREIRRELKKRY